MAVSKIITAAVAAVSMFGASTAFAATRAASKLSVSASPAFKAVRLKNKDKSIARSDEDQRINFLSNPLVIAGFVAAAIAIPIAISNSNRHPGSP